MEAVLSPGDVCGGTKVVRLLGSGGFAQVYEVRDRSGAPRALKILDAAAEARPKVRARLAQEGAALTLLDHVNVVRLYECGVDQDRIYLVLELVEGKNLRDAMRGRPPLETIVRWIRQAAEGVAEAHRRGIVHRDLKPENLLVTSQDVVKVIDFGIAKLTGWGVKTTHEQQMGTALYMPPEQIQGKSPDPRMDVYALGLILYEAVTGVHPIVPGAANVFEITARQLGVRPRPLIEAAPGIPPELGEVVDRAVEKEGGRRLPSMALFSEGLQAAQRRFGEERFAAMRSLVASPGQPPAARPRKPAAGTEIMSAVPAPSSPTYQAAAGQAAEALPYAVTAIVESDTGNVPAPAVRISQPSWPDHAPMPATAPAALSGRGPTPVPLPPSSQPASMPYGAPAAPGSAPGWPQAPGLPPSSPGALPAPGSGKGAVVALVVVLVVMVLGGGAAAALWFFGLL